MNSFHGPSTVSKKAQRYRELFGSDSECDEIVRIVENQISEKIQLESDVANNGNCSQNSDDEEESYSNWKRKSEWERDILQITLETDFDLQSSPKKSNNSVEIQSSVPQIEFQKQDNVPVETTVSLLRYPLATPEKTKKDRLLNRLRIRTNEKSQSAAAENLHRLKSAVVKVHTKSNALRLKVNRSAATKKSPTKNIHHRTLAKNRTHKQASAEQRTLVGLNSDSHALHNDHIHYNPFRSHTKPFRTHTNQHKPSEHRIHTAREQLVHADVTAHPLTRHTPYKHKESPLLYTPYKPEEYRIHTTSEQLAHVNVTVHPLTRHTPYKHEDSPLLYTPYKPEETSPLDPNNTRIITLNNKNVPAGVHFAVAVDKKRFYSKNALKKITRKLMSQI